MTNHCFNYEALDMENRVKPKVEYGLCNKLFKTLNNKCFS